MVMCQRNLPQLRLVFDEYEKITGHPIEKAIENEFSGTSQDSLIALIQCIRNRTEYFVKRLHDSMAGIGTDDKTLIRIIVSRSEIDLGEIKEAYERVYGKSLADRVKVVENFLLTRSLEKLIKFLLIPGRHYRRLQAVLDFGYWLVITISNSYLIIMYFFEIKLFTRKWTGFYYTLLSLWYFLLRGLCTWVTWRDIDLSYFYIILNKYFRSFSRDYGLRRHISESNLKLRSIQKFRNKKFW